MNFLGSSGPCLKTVGWGKWLAGGNCGVGTDPSGSNAMTAPPPAPLRTLGDAAEEGAVAVVAGQGGDHQARHAVPHVGQRLDRLEAGGRGRRPGI